MDFIFPPVCCSCGGFGGGGDRGICRSCRAGFALVSEDDPVYREALSRLTEGGAVSRLVVPWYFEKEGAVQHLIHQLKYGGMTRVGWTLGGELGRYLTSAGVADVNEIIPVPLHTSKLRERGFNQAEYISRGIARVTGWTIATNLLRRKRFTQSQTTLSVSQRAENVRGAFVVRPVRHTLVGGRTFLVVDDVITTGATLHSCAAALKQGGAREVICCGLALASG